MSWWGSKPHIRFTIVVFVVLASLDNAAIGVSPPLYAVIAEDLSVSEVSLGLVTGLTILIAAVSAVMWGYWGDQSSRKRLLFYGTMIWAGATFLTGTSGTLTQFLLFQAAAAVGLGCISSVGYSVLTDFVTSRRRGMVMSLWGLAQGLGMGVGVFLGALLGADDWGLPFLVIAGAGLGFGVLYLLTYDPKRGRAEPEAPEVTGKDVEEEPRIELGDIPHLATKPSNVWLILQGFTAQFAYGSLIWLPRLFAAKMEATGSSLETATAVGGLFAIAFQVGGVFSIFGGYVGDRWQRRDLRGRATLSAIGVLGAIPLYLALFFIPLTGLNIPEPAETGDVIATVFTSLFTNGWVATAFFLALGALALTSVDSPNWFALISEVNLPEHRGTAFGLANLSGGVGRAIGIWLTPAAAIFLESRFAPPLTFAVGLALFQLFFVPTGFCYYMARKTTPRDITEARRTMASRAEETASGDDTETTP